MHRRSEPHELARTQQHRWLGGRGAPEGEAPSGGLSPVVLQKFLRTNDLPSSDLVNQQLQKFETRILAET